MIVEQGNLGRYFCSTMKQDDDDDQLGVSDLNCNSINSMRVRMVMYCATVFTYEEECGGKGIVNVSRQQEGKQSGTNTFPLQPSATWLEEQWNYFDMMRSKSLQGH